MGTSTVHITSEIVDNFSLLAPALGIKIMSVGDIFLGNDEPMKMFRAVKITGFPVPDCKQCKLVMTASIYENVSVFKVEFEALS